ncbi:MAG: hypothetical protein SGARI_001523 [Bacillariaceae sp.]
MPVADEQQKGIPKRSGHKGGVSTPFPDKLHELLENVGHQGQDDIIGWSPHGRAFVLNLYGFSRLTTGPDRGGVKGNGSKAASSPSTEPNFYNMEPCLAKDKVDVINSPMVVDEEVGDEIQLFHEKDLEEDLTRVETPEPLPSGPGALTDEDPITPVSKTAPFWNDDNEVYLGIIDTEAVPNEAKFTSLPPVVTPVTSESRKVFGDADGVPPMLPMIASLDSIELRESSEGIHSGDQVFFEGLPFHYLELKDVEKSLIQGTCV